ncbi:unnamed protein product [Ranitomeya imitator]|uniref:Ras-GEF domain-containing protein n=1 Tax=Ranitomeya imitator TaxID=111125 RepID=A0ABN9KVN6_9NEOB|nr:unnamed protein product [Ranitomeya imitator]
MDLDKLETWAERWQMRFNNDKCKVIHMGRRNQCHHYTLNGKPLGKSDREKDLGILVNDKLTWSSQCQAAAAKANRIMGYPPGRLPSHVHGLHDNRRLKYDGKADRPEALCTKRKVLLLASQWTALYKDWLHDDEHSKLFLKTLYRYVLDDVYEYPMLEKELKEFQKVLRIHRRHTVDEYSPHRKNRALFHQFSLKENWLQHRGNANEIEEIFCRVYITDHSYVSIRMKVSSSVQDILKIVAERIQHPEEDLALVTVTFSGEKHELLPTEMALSKSLDSSSRIYTYRRSDTLNPFAENEETQHRSVRILGMNTWDIALELTSFDWSLFNSIHEQELIYFTFSRQGKGENTLNLSLLLQRCNEVQLWVATEILLCSQLGKRVQLVKKFIKIAAHCKAQRNLNSFFAIIMGLNTASVCRLSQTWEKIPGKLKKLFSELESLTDPSLNHKAYRDAFKKMKPPKIPFMPLLLKDVTFIHEGNKTFLDNLVNFEKLINLLFIGLILQSFPPTYIPYFVLAYTGKVTIRGQMEVYDCRI